MGKDKYTRYRNREEAWYYLYDNSFPRRKFAPEHYYVNVYFAGAWFATKLIKMGHLFRAPILFFLGFWRTIRKD